MVRAEAGGYANEGLFQTTYDAYCEQTEQMRVLAEARKEMDVLVTKEYVKGRQNVVINPVISEFNKTSNARNGTVATLLKIESQYSKPIAEKSKLSGFDE